MTKQQHPTDANLSTDEVDAYLDATEPEPAPVPPRPVRGRRRSRPEPETAPYRHESGVTAWLTAGEARRLATPGSGWSKAD